MKSCEVCGDNWEVKTLKDETGAYFDVCQSCHEKAKDKFTEDAVFYLGGQNE
jgi:ribosome-binding protein aMBF1 (putative translation factor)